MTPGANHPHTGDATFKARHLLDAHHRESYDRLGRAWAFGKREGLQTELNRQLHDECPAASYSFCTDHPTLFNLTMLRTLQRTLESTGYQTWEGALWEIIAERSQKDSDLRVLQMKTNELAVRESHAPSPHFPQREKASRKGIVLRLSSGRTEDTDQWAEVAPLLARRGFEVAEAAWLDFQPGRSAIEDLLRTCHRRRPELIHAVVPYDQLQVVSEGAQSLGIGVLWEPPPGEELPALEASNNSCLIHFPDDVESGLLDLVRSFRVIQAIVLDSSARIARLSPMVPAHVVFMHRPSHASESAEALEVKATFLADVYRDAGVTSRLEPRNTRNAETDDLWVSPEELSDWRHALITDPSDDPGAWFKEQRQTAGQIMDEGWRFEEFPPVKIDSATDWLNSAAENRSWGYHLHSWELMDPVVTEYLRTESREYLDWVLDIAASWAEQCLAGDAHQTMAWYDMSVALRSPRLAVIIHLASAADVSDDQMEPLLCLAMAHQDAHVAKDSFNSANNHGFYAALGQLYLGRSLRAIPGMEGLIAQGAERMRVMSRQQFLQDSGHAEHSPEYHRMLLDSFETAINRDIITDEVIIERIRHASHVLGWFIQPNGKLLQFGDSSAEQMVRASHVHSLDSTTRFLMSRGSTGSPTDQDLFVLPEAGYAIIRTPAPQTTQELGAASYLALAGGFHSRAHKHCDDLSLVWFHRGEEILVDAGRYGYGPQLPNDSPLRKDGFYYDSAERQFVESSGAHNVVTVDGKNHNRRREPFGSGLQTAVEEEGVFHLEAAAPQEGWSWKRSVRLDPASGLKVIDDIQSDSGQQQTYQVYFNFDGDLALAEDESAVTIQGRKMKLRMHWRDPASRSLLVRGQASPLRGWRSLKDRELIPTWSHERSGVFTGSIRLETFFDVC